MQHVTMFKYSDKGEPIRCVISPKFKDEFESLGFVDCIDKVKAPIKRARRKKAES